jgi:hypothetical protein
MRMALEEEVGLRWTTRQVFFFSSAKYSASEMSYF